MTHYIAFTTNADTTWSAAHKRHDKHLIKYTLTHAEGDFAYVDATIKNPREPWLDPTLNVWVWITKDDTPVFFGRLDAVPEELSRELVLMKFVARPEDYEVLKIALANSKKVAPFWDRVFINEDQEDNPDVVFEAYPELIHVDRVDLSVTASNIIVGEDGMIVINNHIYDSLSMNRGSSPVRRVRVEAEVSWPQTATGTVEITQQLLDAFAAAGSEDNRMSSFTGQGLEEDHPEQFDSLRGGWEIGETSLLRVDGISVGQKYKDVTIQPVATQETEDDAVAVGSYPSYTLSGAATADPYVARFYLWELVPTMFLNYEAKRQRIEYLSVEVFADMQPSSRDDAELVVVPIQSKRVIEPIDPGDTMPIGSLHANTYFVRDRGKQSVEYLIMLCRAILLANSRAVEVTVAYTFDFGLQYSCRKNCTIIDPRLPNGQAIGKIIRYTLVAENGGKEFSTVTIGCAIGRGNVVEPVEGEPGYGEDDWDDGYQQLEGAWLGPVEDIIYEDYNNVPIVDDGANFDNLDVVPFIKNFEVVNGETAQRAVLDNTFPDIPAAIEALNANETEVILELEPIDGVGPFTTTYVVNTSPLQVPRLIDLESA